MVLGILPGELTLQFISYPLYSMRINSHTCKRRKKPPPPSNNFGGGPRRYPSPPPNSPKNSQSPKISLALFMYNDSEHKKCNQNQINYVFNMPRTLECRNKQKWLRRVKIILQRGKRGGGGGGCGVKSHQWVSSQLKVWPPFSLPAPHPLYSKPSFAYDS